MPDDNLPILYRNIMYGLSSNFARDVFLWAVERPGEDRLCYRAEAFARKVHNRFSVLMPMLHSSARQHGREDVDPDLIGFMLERWANHEYGGNIKLPAHLRTSVDA